MRGAFVVVATGSVWLSGSPAAAFEHADYDQLVLVGSAYTKAKGETEIAVFAARSPAADADFAAELGLGHGVTDKFELGVVLPYVDADSGSGLGDVSFELGFALVEESAAMPAVRLGLSAIAPTGDSDRGLGYDA